LKDFNAELSKYIAQIQRMPVKTMAIIYPINANFGRMKTQKNFKVNRLDIKLIDYTTFDRDFYSKILQQTKQHHELVKSQPYMSLFRRFLFAVINIKGREPVYAVNKSFESVQLFLASINYPKCWGRNKVTLVGTIKPFSELLSPYEAFVFARKKYVNAFSFGLEKQDKIVDLDGRDYKNFIHFYKILLRLKQTSPNTRRVFECLRIYHSATTEKSLHTAFLQFWTILEIATLKDLNTKDAEVMYRIRSIILKRQKHIDLLIALTYLRRNRLVHASVQDEITQNGVNFVKQLAEMMIDFLLSHAKYTENEIRFIYRMGKNDPTQLRRYKSILDYLARQKSKP